MSTNQFLNMLAVSIVNGIVMYLATSDYFFIFCIVLGVASIMFLVIIVMDILGNTANWITALQILFLGYFSLGIEFLIDYLMHR